MTKKNIMHCILIDDEPDAIVTLQTILDTYCEGIEVVGKADNAFKAFKLIEEFNPELIFLDVEMPGINGFDLLEELTDPRPEVIFTTAYEKYAISAIRNNAVDYLLKPIDVDELINAVKKAEERLNKKSGPAKNSGVDYKIKLASLDEIIFASPSEIINIEGDGRYTRVHFVSGKVMLIAKNLKEFEDELLPSGFFRVHKSQLINCNHVKKISNTDGYFVELSNNKSIEISRRRKMEFMEFLKNNH
jgi:two-component system LytT family response regulator